MSCVRVGASSRLSGACDSASTWLPLAAATAVKKSTTAPTAAAVSAESRLKRALVADERLQLRGAAP